MTAKKDNRLISEMRNLGPACELDLNAVGIDWRDLTEEKKEEFKAFAAE